MLIMLALLCVWLYVSMKNLIIAIIIAAVGLAAIILLFIVTKESFPFIIES